MASEEPEDPPQVFLFDPRILRELRFDKEKSGTYRRQVATDHPMGDLMLRPLCNSDYQKGYMELIGQLTVAGDVSDDDFERRFLSMKHCPNTYYVAVVEDTAVGRVVATGTLLREQKFLRGCSSRVHVEDIAVLEAYRGQELGKFVVDVLLVLSKRLGIYKVTLDCSDGVVEFYKKLGFGCVNNMMTKRFV